MDQEKYLKNVICEFQKTKDLADKALMQISDEVFFKQVDNDSNSIALIIKHISGNQHSRWTDFLTTDGEKENRNRDNEFVILNSDTRDSLMINWEAGWKVLFDSLLELTPVDLDRIITIRHEEHTVYAAINRQLTHYAQHVGQIVLLAKHFTGENWETLSVPKGKSEEFNRQMFNK